jgi:hypothetical protein
MDIWLIEKQCILSKILLNLSRFTIVVPNQVRAELVCNLPDRYMKEFYQLVNEAHVQLDYENVPDMYITIFESKGLKKGDAVIGGFAEWKKVDSIVSDNRDFLRGLSAGYYFTVMSPQEFCAEFGL